MARVEKPIKKSRSVNELPTKVLPDQPWIFDYVKNPVDIQALRYGTPGRGEGKVQKKK